MAYVPAVDGTTNVFPLTPVPLKTPPATNGLSDTTVAACEIQNKESVGVKRGLGDAVKRMRILSLAEPQLWLCVTENQIEVVSFTEGV